MKKIIVDGENAVLGRLGCFVAKELLIGNEVVVINAEKTVISGNRDDILLKMRILRKKGGSSQKGPKFSKLPDLLLKRMIRGMLPWDRPKGRDAHKRLKCFIGTGKLTQEELKNAIKLNHRVPEKHVILKEMTDLL